LNCSALTYNCLSLISAPKIHTDLLWDLTFMFVTLAALYFLSIFFFRNKISGRSSKVRRHKKELAPMISEFLFFEEESDHKEKTNYLNLRIEIRELIKDPRNRVVLSEILMDLSRDVSGETQKRLFRLYHDLGLHKNAFKKLSSWRWEVISKGILELTQMQVAESYSFIIKFINDRRSTIRKQAEIATVSLRAEGINYFLDTTKYSISEWQQLKLLDVLRNIPGYNPPRFKDWLTSKNRDVVLFAIRLIKFYNQNDANASLIQLLKHRNNHIKQEAIQCVKEFHIVTALDTLKLIFQKGNTDVKISILDAIAVLGGVAELGFLRYVESNDSNFAVRSKAISAINRIVPESIMPTEGIEKGLTHNWTADTAPDSLADRTMSGGSQEIPNAQIAETEGMNEKEKAVDIPIRDIEVEEELLEITENKDTILDHGINLDFLPIVVTTISVEPSPADTVNRPYSFSEKQGMHPKSILELSVNYEILDADYTLLKEDVAEIEIDLFWEDLDGSDLNFLPIVTDAEDSATPLTDITETSALEPNEKCESTHYFEWGPDVAETLEFPEEVGTAGEGDYIPDSVHDIRWNRLLDLEVEYEDLEAESAEDISELPELDYMEWPMEALEVSVTTEEPSRSQENENELSSEMEYILQQLPKPKYYSKEVLSVLELLDQIEELGDHREIPLLHEIMEQSKIEYVLERAQDIIKRLTKTSDMEDEISWELDTWEEDLVEYNVFEELFTKCDTDSKIILMKEMLVVGDEKEVRFLKKLLHQETEPKLRATVKKVLKQLIDRLDIEEGNSLQSSWDLPKQHTELPDSDQQINLGRTKTELPGNTFGNQQLGDWHAADKEVTILDQLRSIPEKLLDKLNG